MINVEPISRRAKNRVREHGSTFRVRTTGIIGGMEDDPNDILCVSMDGTWSGWFEVGVDIKILVKGEG